MTIPHQNSDTMNNSNTSPEHGNDDPASGGDEQDRYHLCMTCARLKHESLFEIGDCTCEDCHEAGFSKIRVVEADDGDGFVSVSRNVDDDNPLEKLYVETDEHENATRQIGGGGNA